MDNVQVSVICAAYNHEKYIRDALEGFVMQQTNFPFEVVIHDDASTDGTADIIREYKNKYPWLIKPIYQAENQYSQKKSITKNFLLPNAAGRYVAICEGDDYWTDPLKLQKQYDAMEKNSQVDICAHRAMSMKEGKTGKAMAPLDRDGIIPVEEVILNGGGRYVATASLMLRKSVLAEETPMMKIISLDYVMQMQGALRGGMLYLNDCMAVYRLMTDGSWTKRMNAQVEKRIAHSERVISVLKALNEYTHYQYEETVDRAIRKIEFKQLERKKQYGKMFGKEYRKIFLCQPIRVKLRLILRALMG